MTRKFTKTALIATAIVSFTCGVLALALVSARGDYEPFYEED